MIWMFLDEAAEEPAKGGTNVLSIVLVGVLVVAMVGLLIWQNVSNKKKQKKAQEKIDSIKVGDRVKTIGGICGYLVSINKDENTFILETGEGDKKSYMKFDRQAIYQTAPGDFIETKSAENKEEPVADEEKKEAKKTATKKKKSDIDSL